jgi:hypothetical protein
MYLALAGMLVVVLPSGAQFQPENQRCVRQ